MSKSQPGGCALTEYAVKTAGIKPGSRLLDAGCGDGASAAFLQENMGLEVVAIDIDKDAVEKAKEKGVDARVMDASMLEFDIHEFDAVLMEGVFTELKRQEESVHEAFCVLKNGGNLIISDYYRKDPDMERWEHDYWSAMAQFRKPRVHEDCGKEENIPSPYMQDGGVVFKGLTDLLEELEMKVVLLEDHTAAFPAQAEEAPQKGGELLRNTGGSNENLGWFLLIAHKN